MKPIDLRQKSEPELIKLEGELREELFRLSIRHSTGQLERVANISKTKKDIARVKTILNERAKKG